jgi:hypothetical protein
MVVTTPPRAASCVPARGTGSEWEVLNPAHVVHDATSLIRKGFDKPPGHGTMAP